MTDPTPAPAAPMRPDTKRYSGPWLLYRNTPKGLRTKIGGAKMPSFRHQTYEAAQAEAERLAAKHPGCTILIMQESARVKMKPVEVAG